MRKNLTEIVFILDRSESMSGLEQDTIGGFNSMINQQKNAEGEALVSTILFDNVSEVLHSIRCDNKHCMFRNVFPSCILMNISNMMYRSANSI